jgi:hypothetical protein
MNMKLLQMGFLGLIFVIATACAGTNAGVKNGKHMVWVPSDTGSHIGGRWVAVDETGSATNTGASNVQRASGEQLQAQQLQSPSGSGGTGR